MKKTELKSSEKKTILKNLNQKDDSLSKELSLRLDQEKTQENRLPPGFVNNPEINPTQTVEDAEIITPSEQMDTIIKNNDKFETVKVIMAILCKELNIPVDAGIPEIAKALNRVYEAYFRSMEEWKNLVKTSKINDIRQ